MIKFIISSKEQAELACQKILEMDFANKKVLEVKKHVQKQSLAQQGLLHLWIGEIAEQTGETPKECKMSLKRSLLSPEFVEYTNHRTGLKQVLALYKSTGDMDVKETSKFMQDIEHLAGSMGWKLSYPEDLAWSLVRERNAI